jgi:hypothetical protein
LPVWLVDDEVGPGQDIFAAIGDDDQVGEIWGCEEVAGFAAPLGFPPDDDVGRFGFA